MKLVRRATELRTKGRPVCLAIGMFDGVHLGHQQVIRQAVTDAEQHEGLAVVVTFDRHPAAVLAPQRVPPLIYTLPQKLRAIEALGADAVLLIHFDRQFSSQPGEDFIRELAGGLGRIFSVCVGSAFTFGHQRTGNVDLLRRLGREMGFVVHGLAAVSLDGRRVSSTRIREAIRGGELDAAQQMLGREYSLSGPVVRGDRLGRQLGFPTANLDPTGLVLPPGGVYAIHAKAGRRQHRGVLNIGHRPTLKQPAPQLRVEAHLFDFRGNLYGQELEVTFVAKVREERKFPSLDALRQQIERDVAEVRTKFLKPSEPC
ncbi:MAG: bifunctional riboflavin kinase/FAD synthetase [Verrucomicrobia bacterium]|nr:bifunctional riboflavin kinase/FAD synthetase [Verrucomicrobiota bacterium]